MASITGKEYLDGRRLAASERERFGRASGPAFGNTPLVWGDQLFGFELEPTGTVEPENALRVGATQNGLDVIIVASHANDGDLTISAGCKLTLDIMQSDTVNGVFEEVGPSICITAPAGGLVIGRGELVARFALGNMSKPWAKVKLTIDGTISGGNIDIALAYVAR